MSRYVHITRADRWLHSASTPISREEWLRYIHSDEELRTPTEQELAEGLDPDDAVFRFNGTEVADFVYTDGLIEVKNPSDKILMKMQNVARALNAKILDESDSLLVEISASGAKWQEAAAEPKDTIARIIAVVGGIIVVGGLSLIFLWLLSTLR